MFTQHSTELVTAHDDDWEDTAAAGPIGKWLGGAILPLLCAGYGISCFITHHGLLAGQHGGSLDVFGPRAIALGIVAISLGLFLHCHYFWGNLYYLAALAVLGKVVALMGFIAGLGYLIVQIGVFGRA